jgi:hypothetical protein
MEPLLYGCCWVRKVVARSNPRPSECRAGCADTEKINMSAALLSKWSQAAKHGKAEALLLCRGCGLMVWQGAIQQAHEMKACCSNRLLSQNVLVTMSCIRSLPPTRAAAGLHQSIVLQSCWQSAPCPWHNPRQSEEHHDSQESIKQESMRSSYYAAAVCC